jgi:hypothetical protein
MERLEMKLSGSIEGRVIPNLSVITLVGQNVGGNESILNRVRVALKGMNLVDMGSEQGEHCCTFAARNSPANSVVPGRTDSRYANPVVSHSLRKARLLEQLRLGSEANPAH